eukprot:2703075-Prymnesium_polylepis.2
MGLSSVVPFKPVPKKLVIDVGHAVGGRHEGRAGAALHERVREVATLCEHGDTQLNIMCLEVAHVISLPPVRDTDALREEHFEVADVCERLVQVLERRRAIVLLLADAIRRRTSVARWVDTRSIVHVAAR